MKEINKVNTAHIINSVALSAIGVYFAAYLITLGYPLSRVILFYVISHAWGLIFGLFIIVPLIKKWGTINTFKLYYPLQIIYLLLLNLLQFRSFPPEIIALFYGAAIFAYWIPINVLFITHSENRKMSENLSRFFAFPKLFGIAGPLIAAFLIPVIGFWPFFAVAVFGMVLSYIPLTGINDKDIRVSLDLSKAWQRLKRQKLLFVFEGLDNIIEEAEWFWSIYVFLLIGSLSAPGIVGSLQKVGGVAFTLLVGKYAKTHAKKMIPIAAIALMSLYALRLFINTPASAYIVAAVASFVMTLFLVSYFSTIYKTIKGDEEVEFVILREIPTVLGRMVVFGTIFLTLTNLRLFFIMPFIFTGLLLTLYFWKKKLLAG
jgi:hypothetical protein